MTRRRAAITAVLLALVAAGGTPAQAQNVAQIARVRGGGACPGCNLFQADLTGLERIGLNLAGARLRQAELSLAVLNRANLARADLRDVNAYGAVFGGANFSGANLTNAGFVGAYLEGANFSGTTLTGANFSGAEMATARGLSQALLDPACGDAATRLPAGLHIPTC
ncbi:MAG: pentapeptide repeat-containing protein [Brevundimonas sp.]|jgi:uncharacterized protein YjbI with pentapeptide repeats|uniref:pentapeptide repeat-containing protein n=1 Tax=Brevundimonas sp. TaxID=1871086 RepID=UPI00391B2370